MRFNLSDQWEAIPLSEYADYPELQEYISNNTIRRAGYVSFDDRIGGLNHNNYHQLQLILSGYVLSHKAYATNTAPWQLYISYMQYTLMEGHVPDGAEHYSPGPSVLEPAATHRLSIRKLRRCTQAARNALPQPQELRGIAIALTQQANQFFRVYQQGSHLYLYIYEDLTPRTLFIILSSLGAVFPQLRMSDPLTNALTNQDPDEFCSLLNGILVQLNAAKEEQQRAVRQQEFAEFMSTRVLRGIQSRHENIRQRILELEQNYTSALVLLHQIEQERTAQESINHDTSATAFAQYLFKRKPVTLQSWSPDRIAFTVTSPVLYYDVEALQRLLTTSRQNQFNEDPRVKQALTNIFIDNIHRMNFKTGIYWNIINFGIEYSNDHTGNGPANPHLSEFNCFGDNKSLIIKALREQNYEFALEQTIASCASLNFYDSPVMGRLFTKLYSDGTNLGRRKLIQIDANQVMTWREYLASEYCNPKEAVHEADHPAE